MSQKTIASLVSCQSQCQITIKIMQLISTKKQDAQVHFFIELLFIIFM